MTRTRKMKPRSESKKKIQPYTRDAFHGLLNRIVLETDVELEAVSPAVLHAKLGEVLRVLERRGFEYEGSTETRLDPDRDLEYA